MDVVAGIGGGVLLVAAAVVLCLLGRPSVAKALVALFAGCFTGAIYVATSEWVQSGFPEDPRYYSMDVPRFAFQGFFAGGIVSLGFIFVVTLWRLIRLASNSAVESSRMIERKP